MQAFTTSHKDALISVAAAVLFNEDLTTVKDKVAKLKVGSVTNFGTVKAISDNAVEFKAADTGVTRITLNQRKMGSKEFVLDSLKVLKEDVDLDEAKGADPANLRSIITNHTELLRKADKPEAKEFHRTAIANAKEKLKALGEEVELDEAYYTPRDATAKKALELIIDMDDIADLVEFMKGLSSYYVDFGKQNEQPDSIAFGKHLTAAYTVIKDWH